jgi:hypothetical protein
MQHRTMTGHCRCRPATQLLTAAPATALPVTEQVDLPFASQVRPEYDGQQVGVIHAA